MNCDNCKAKPAKYRFVIGLMDPSSPVLSASFFDFCIDCATMPFQAVVKAMPALDVLAASHQAVGFDMGPPGGPAQPPKMTVEEIAERLIHLSGRGKPS